MSSKRFTVTIDVLDDDSVTTHVQTDVGIANVEAYLAKALFSLQVELEQLKECPAHKRFMQ